MPGTDRKVQFPTGLYDESADAAADIRAAIAKAKAANKRVLVMWGENKCGFCVYLSDLIWYESAACRTLLDNEYEFVKVDILSPALPGQVKGQFGKHNDVARKYGAADNVVMGDAPRLTIIDPVTDRGVQTLIGSQMVAKPMTMDRVFDEQVILPFLANNVATPKPAFDMIDAAAKQAQDEEKAVLVVFGASEYLCEACAAWETWLARPDVAAIMNKSFVLARVDAERMTGGRSLMERLSGNPKATVPVLVALTDRAKAFEPPVVCAKWPTNESEATAFVDSLARAAGAKLTDADRAALVGTFKAK
jgi:thioredoxin-related protein